MIRCLANTSEILLSFFDGIATAAYILKELQVKTPLFMAWEDDRGCIDIALKHFPDMWARGKLENDDMSDLTSAIKEADPESKAIVLVTGGAPCWDYSIMKKNPAGRKGQSGQYFDLCLDKIQPFLQELQKTHVVMQLFENQALRYQTLTSTLTTG